MSEHDGRVSCTTCTHYSSNGFCDAFGRRYSPSIDIPRRCEKYVPKKNVADQRTGKERFPFLEGA
jgi:hypothetical protein